ncbi:hypothetical protein R0J87_25335, partial [Halomonas sp. SIMBA_159]
YRQVLLQQQTPETDPDIEQNYQQWISGTEKTQQFMTETFGTVCRSRIAVTPPGQSLEWHIDTDTSVLCRIQIGLQT